MQSTSDLNRHRRVLGILYVVFSALLALGALGVFAMFVSGALPSSNVEERKRILWAGGVLATLMLLLSLPGFIGGVGLLKRRAWSKALTLILAVLNLLSVPIGTALGIYTIWFWLQPDVRGLFFPPESEPRGPEIGGPNIRRPLAT
jgi:hypothetical protein